MTTKKAISILKNVLWVGRVTVFVAGLAVTLALVLGVATAAFGANGGNLILGRWINRGTIDHPTPPHRGT
jgi:ABC-type dipeptide/oligopeptide/nickel transport system permease subunit